MIDLICAVRPLRRSPRRRRGDRKNKHLRRHVLGQKTGSSVGFPCGRFRMVYRARPMTADLVLTERTAFKTKASALAGDAARTSDLTTLMFSARPAHRSGRLRF